MLRKKIVTDFVAERTKPLDYQDADGIGFAGPFHPEVTWPTKNKNAADAAFDVF